MVEDNNIISIKNLHKSFGNVHVLKGIDLNVKKGHLISIIGRSGCGKTTLLRCMNCLEIFDEGTMRIAGITISRKKTPVAPKARKSRALEVRKALAMPFQGFEKKQIVDEDFQLKAQTLRLRVGMLFQSLNLFPHLTVLENVTIAPTIVKNEDKEAMNRKAIELLDKVGLADFTKRYPHELSGGQAQRVAIARALAMNPQVMLYDEPTSALDPEITEEVLSVMRTLHSEGMTQVVVTHAMGFARTASDVIIYMHEGEIIESGSPREVFESPKDARTKSYLSIITD